MIRGRNPSPVLACVMRSFSQAFFAIYAMLAGLAPLSQCWGESPFEKAVESWKILDSRARNMGSCEMRVNDSGRGGYVWEGEETQYEIARELVLAIDEANKCKLQIAPGTPNPDIVRLSAINDDYAFFLHKDEGESGDYVLDDYVLLSDSNQSLISPASGNPISPPSLEDPLCSPLKMEEVNRNLNLRDLTDPMFKLSGTEFIESGLVAMTFEYKRNNTDPRLAKRIIVADPKNYWLPVRSSFSIGTDSGLELRGESTFEWSVDDGVVTAMSESFDLQRSENGEYHSHDTFVRTRAITFGEPSTEAFRMSYYGFPEPSELLARDTSKINWFSVALAGCGIALLLVVGYLKTRSA